MKYSIRQKRAIVSKLQRRQKSGAVSIVLFRGSLVLLSSSQRSLERLDATLAVFLRYARFGDTRDWSAIL